jgi:hypothetical protein
VERGFGVLPNLVTLLGDDCDLADLVQKLGGELVDFSRCRPGVRNDQSGVEKFDGSKG